MVVIAGIDRTAHPARITLGIFLARHLPQLAEDLGAVDAVFGNGVVHFEPPRIGVQA